MRSTQCLTRMTQKKVQNVNHTWGALWKKEIKAWKYLSAQAVKLLHLWNVSTIETTTKVVWQFGRHKLLSPYCLHFTLRQNNPKKPQMAIIHLTFDARIKPEQAMAKFIGACLRWNPEHDDVKIIWIWTLWLSAQKEWTNLSAQDHSDSPGNFNFKDWVPAWLGSIGCQTQLGTKPLSMTWDKLLWVRCGCVCAKQYHLVIL